jgi:hypothetical protein
MKKIFSIGLLLAGTLCSGNQVNAQSALTLEGSQNITNFKFFDSSGQKIDGYAPQYSGGYALGYRYGLGNGLYFPVKIGMRKAGATYVYDNSNYSWNLNYVEMRLGVGYEYSFGKFGAHFSVMGYYGNLLKANQLLNNENFDIRKSGDISKTDFGVFLSPGADYAISDNLKIFVDINYMLGLANLETDGTQKSNNTLFGGTLGLNYTIK